MRLLVVLPAFAFLLPLSAQEWSAWKPDATFSGIAVRERCSGFSEFSNRYMWDVQLRNDYSKSVDLAWEAEPALLHGPDSQTDHAAAVRPGETIEARATAPKDCSSGLLVRVDDVKQGSAAPPQTGGNPAPGRTGIQGTWRSKDPEPYQKQLQVQFVGNTVTGVYTSPSFSFQITTPLPERVLRSVQVDAPADTPGPPLKTR